jgi:hypothetical protein
VADLTKIIEEDMPQSERIDLYDRVTRKVCKSVSDNRIPLIDRILKYETA